MSTLRDLRQKLENSVTTRFYLSGQNTEMYRSKRWWWENALIRTEPQYEGEAPDKNYTSEPLDPKLWHIMECEVYGDEPEGEYAMPRLEHYPKCIWNGYLKGLDPKTDEEPLRYVAWDSDISSFMSALQPAFWLGFDPIYLLGHDLSSGYVYNQHQHRGLSDYSEHNPRIPATL